jgi:hypothetical protein
MGKVHIELLNDSFDEFIEFQSSYKIEKGDEFYLPQFFTKDLNLDNVKKYHPKIFTHTVKVIAWYYVYKELELKQYIIVDYNTNIYNNG